MDGALVGFFLGDCVALKLRGSSVSPVLVSVASMRLDVVVWFVGVVVVCI